MNKRFKLLSASISAALASAMQSTADTTNETIDTDTPGRFGDIPIKSDLNTHLPVILAAHSSHRSHGSHRSHRSSSRPSGAPAPLYVPPAPEQEPRKRKQSDPLGQPPKPKDTYDPSIPDAEQLLRDKELRKLVIMRIQIALQISGEYKGAIDGIMGPQTRDAIDIYKIKKGLPRGGYLDLDTLNALGIPIN